MTTADVVGIFDANFKQLVPEGRPIKAAVKPAAKFMEHPLEDGSTVTDHRVYLPIEIELTIVLQGAEESRALYERFKEIYRQAETVTVQTRAGAFPSMAIEAMPHDETSDVADALPLVLKLREAVFVAAQFQALPPKAAAAGADGKGKRNASTVKRGEQAGKPETASKRGSSVLYSTFYGGGG
jgi:hypothetical protein